MPTITLPPHAELLQLGQLTWIEQQSTCALQQYTAAAMRLPNLARAVADTLPDQRYDALQALVAAAVHARTQWERLLALRQCARDAGLEALPAP